MRITFLKLYKKTMEGDFYGDAIVAYGEKDWEQDGNYITKKKHLIFINLWLVHLKHHWISKTHYEKTY